LRLNLNFLLSAGAGTPPWRDARLPALLCLAPLSAGLTQVPTSDRLQALERELARLSAELGALRQERDTQTQRVAELESRQQALSQELAGAQPRSGGWPERLTLGGYGEIHFSRIEGPGASRSTTSASWPTSATASRTRSSCTARSSSSTPSSRTARVRSRSSSCTFDFRLSDRTSVRAGRFLTAAGHPEPDARADDLPRRRAPAVRDGRHPHHLVDRRRRACWATWPRPALPLYVGSSLDGTGFDPIEGIREGPPGIDAGLVAAGPLRTAGLERLALRGRQPALRAWFFGGGLDNGNAGVNPGLDADLWIAGLRRAGQPGEFDLRAAYAYEKIQGAQDIGGNVASAIDGYYAETAWHAWRSNVGTEAAQDLAFFVRYDKVDTQKEMPEGVSPDPRGRRDEITLGASYSPCATW
jgi:hypothetical protein